MDALGLPIRIHVAPGNENDIDHGPALVEGLQAGAVIADMAYDADRFRETIAALPAKPVIPPSASRSLKPHCDFHLYRERNLVERLVGRLKQFRRVNTRYDKVVSFFRGFVLLAAICLWLQ